MLGIKSASAIFLLALNVLPARCLSIDDVGTFSYLVSLLTVFSFVVIWGTDRYCLKNVALSRDEKEVASDKPQGAPSQLKTQSAIFGSYSIVLINALLFSLALLWWMPAKFAEDYSIPLGISAILILLFRSTTQLSSSITKGLNQVIVSEVVTGLIRPLCFIIPLGLAYFTSTNISLTQTLGLFAGSFCVATVLCLAVNRRSDLVFWSPDTKSIPILYSISFFFLLTSVGLPLMANINTIQLGNMRPKAEVALFATAAKLVSVVLLALISANLVIAPKLSPLFYSNNIVGMRKLIRSNNLFVGVLTLVPIVIFVFFAESVLLVFGPKYTAAALALRVLMVGQAVSVCCGPVVLTSTMVGMQKPAAIIILCACLLNWVICLLLIPYFGMMGAVLASVVSNTLLNAVLALVIYQRIGLNVTMLNLLR